MTETEVDPVLPEKKNETTIDGDIREERHIRRRLTFAMALVFLICVTLLAVAGPDNLHTTWVR
jgi:cell division protein FtsB